MAVAGNWGLTAGSCDCPQLAAASRRGDRHRAATRGIRSPRPATNRRQESQNAHRRDAPSVEQSHDTRPFPDGQLERGRDGLSIAAVDALDDVRASFAARSGARRMSPLDSQ
jgi:hypothetical protein